jgi:hypothetical protein
MGFFEQYPWLLVLIIIVTVEGWNALKALAREVIRTVTAESSGPRHD